MIELDSKIKSLQVDNLHKERKILYWNHVKRNLHKNFDTNYSNSIIGSYIADNSNENRDQIYKTTSELMNIKEKLYLCNEPLPKHMKSCQVQRPVRIVNEDSHFHQDSINGGCLNGKDSTKLTEKFYRNIYPSRNILNETKNNLFQTSSLCNLHIKKVKKKRKKQNDKIDVNISNSQKILNNKIEYAIRVNKNNHRLQIWKRDNKSIASINPIKNQEKNLQLYQLKIDKEQKNQASSKCIQRSLKLLPGTSPKIDANYNFKLHENEDCITPLTNFDLKTPSESLSKRKNNFIKKEDNVEIALMAKLKNKVHFKASNKVPEGIIPTSTAEKRHIWKGENGIFKKELMENWYKHMKNGFN